MRSKNMTTVLLAAAMGLLIFDSRTAISAASEGIQLCIRTVIPSLFPFCIMGTLFTGNFPQSGLLRPLGKLFRMKPGTEQLLITGFLGGYPIGAQNIAQLHQKGLLTRAESNRLLSFLSQPGPAFIFGILGNTFSVTECWLLWLVLLGSAWIVSFCVSHEASQELPTPPFHPTSLPEAMRKALSAMGNICGWILWMRVCIGFCEKWLLRFFPLPCRIIFTGILELTNGCCMLASLENKALSFILAAFFLSFGGICVLLQTRAVIGDLSMEWYLKGKILQALICVCLAAGLMIHWTAFLPVLSIFPLKQLKNMRKNSSIPEIIGV